jgi:hypothetical protein
MLSRPMIVSISKTWWTRLWSLKTKEESWSIKGRCSALDLRGATREFVLVLSRRNLTSAQVSRLDSLECKLWVKDFRLHIVRFNTLVFNLLTLHRHHCKGTVMHRILVLWDHATVKVRLGTMLIGVPGSRQIRLQHQAQIRTSTAMLTTVQPLQQGKIKLVLA